MLRHYDREGIVSPTGRTVGGYREYSSGDIQRLFQVESLRSLGMSLRELRRALDDPDFTPRRIVGELIASTQQAIVREQELLRRLRHVHDSESDEWADVLQLVSLLRGLDSDDPRERQRTVLATAAPSATGDPAGSGRLLAEKVLDEGELNVAGTLRWALRRSSEGALDVLGPALDSPDAERRLRAVLAIAELDTVDAAATLITALGNPDPAIRTHAALALGSRGDTLAVPELLEMVAAGTRDVDAADALGRLAAQHGVHEQIVGTIAERLGNHRTVAAARLRLVQALAELRGPSTDAALEALAGDADRAVALTASAILGRRPE